MRERNNQQVYHKPGFMKSDGIWVRVNFVASPPESRIQNSEVRIDSQPLANVLRGEFWCYWMSRMIVVKKVSQVLDIQLLDSDYWILCAATMLARTRTSRPSRLRVRQDLGTRRARRSRPTPLRTLKGNNPVKKLGDLCGLCVKTSHAKLAKYAKIVFLPTQRHRDTERVLDLPPSAQRTPRLLLKLQTRQS